MEDSVRVALRWALALFGLTLALHLVLLDVPFMTGMVFACGPDPNRPGRTICFYPSPIMVVGRVAGVAASAWLWHQLRPNAMI